MYFRFFCENCSGGWRVKRAGAHECTTRARTQQKLTRDELKAPDMQHKTL